MAKGTTIRMWKRSLIVLVCLMACFGIVMFRLVYLQIGIGGALQQKAIDQQLKDTTINAQRGTIYDCNMKPLAQSATVWTVVLEPAYLDTPESQELVADGLSKILNMDKGEILKKASKKSYYTIIKKKVESIVKDKILQFKADIKMDNGIRLVEDYKRYYPYGDFASSALGFVGADNQGLAGIEANYNKELTGEKGKLVTAKNATGTDMPFDYEQLIPAEDGKNLVLTIDEVIQHHLEKSLDEGIINNKVVNRAAAIVMEVNTGAILGMAVKEGFDLNDPFTIVNKEAEEQINALPDEQKSTARAEALNKQWRNKAVSDTYMPGSVFKMFTAAMGFEENVVSEESTFCCTGAYVPYEGASAIHCHYHPGHGTINFVQAMCKSCNPAFIMLGQKVGADNFYKYYKAFGFAEKTGIDLPGEMSDIFFSEFGDSAPMNLAVASFGQNFSITPIQMITAISAIANGGNLVQPHVVSKITDSKGNIIKSFEPKIKRSVISKSTAQRVSAMLLENASNGSGKNGSVEGYKIAGKTGTSEKIGTSREGKKDYIASYGGFAPSDNPKIAMLVFFDTPEGDVYYGGAVAAPAFAQTMKGILPYLGIEKQYEQENSDSADIMAPAVSGKAVSKAKQELESLGLNVSIMGSGDTVISQIPDSTRQIPRGGRVVLYTDSESAESKVTVPDLIGKSIYAVNNELANCNLNLKVAGVNKDSGQIISKAQNIAQGTEVMPGTIVTVNFIEKDNVE